MRLMTAYVVQMFKDKDRIPRRVHFKGIEGDPASVDAMRKAGLDEAQALIIGGSSSAPRHQLHWLLGCAHALAVARSAHAVAPSLLSVGCIFVHLARRSEQTVAGAGALPWAE